MDRFLYGQCELFQRCEWKQYNRHFARSHSKRIRCCFCSYYWKLQHRIHGSWVCRKFNGGFVRSRYSEQNRRYVFQPRKTVLFGRDFPLVLDVMKKICFLAVVSAVMACSAAKPVCQVINAADQLCITVIEPAAAGDAMGVGTPVTIKITGAQLKALIPATSASAPPAK